ncbi:hypothetical protein Asi02nite_01630 [Asanoa siamensis]|uniref:Uncharacterized protein n=1 Tax=Asanoa siamensis TaxID=926357 RepID=A0ABQ4CH72_9ACTN|nr:hypothetical protein Asi02nite_01630 [Asanoa siamensis]
MDPASTPETSHAAPIVPVTRPIWKTEPVSWRTSTGTARVVSESPATETVCRIQKRTKFRSRRSDTTSH